MTAAQRPILWEGSRASSEMMHHYTEPTVRFWGKKESVSEEVVRKDNERISCRPKRIDEEMCFLRLS